MFSPCKPIFFCTPYPLLDNRILDDVFYKRKLQRKAV